VLEAMRVPGLESPDELKAEEEAAAASEELLAEETGI
jgi:hypothetical protein